MKGVPLPLAHGLFISLDRAPLRFLCAETQRFKNAPNLRLSKLDAYIPLMSIPTRLSVHSSVPKPCSVGLRNSAFRICDNCSQSSRAGRIPSEI
jgi:hypothetical protein